MPSLMRLLRKWIPFGQKINVSQRIKKMYVDNVLKDSINICYLLSDVGGIVHELQRPTS